MCYSKNLSLKAYTISPCAVQAKELFVHIGMPCKQRGSFLCQVDRDGSFGRPPLDLELALLKFGDVDEISEQVQ
jgi:hypothetical protein